MIETKPYVCICGKLFDNPQSYNGHKSHCKVHQLNKHGTLEKYAERQRNALACAIEVKHNQKEESRKIKETTWLEEKHRCEYCNEPLLHYYGSGRFCNAQCARAFSTRNNRNEISQKVKSTFQKKQLAAIKQYNLIPNRCVICNQPIIYENRDRKTCNNPVCVRTINAINGSKGGHKGGIRSATVQNRRSTHEIEFCTLCENHFGKDKVLHNIRMFDDWDADVIIPEYRLAILWDGPWHFRKVTESHKLAQVQQRDRNRIQAIIACNYIPYIIQDNTDRVYNRNFVQDEFNQLLQFIAEMQ